MMAEKKEDVVPIETAIQAVASASRRIALLHLSYAKTLIEAFGEERGRTLILNAIKDYGEKIGKKTKAEVEAQGLEPLPENFGLGKSYALPKIGMHTHTEFVDVKKEQRRRAHGCMLAKVWREYGEASLGRLYCYMDVAKYMGYNPKYKLVHTKTMPDGDPYCELVVRKTTETEREDFSTKNKAWIYIDR